MGEGRREIGKLGEKEVWVYFKHTLTKIGIPDPSETDNLTYLIYWYDTGENGVQVVDNSYWDVLNEQWRLVISYET